MVAAREARFTFTADIDRFFRNLDTAQKKMDDLGNSGDRSAVKVTNSMDRSSAAIQNLGDRSAAAAIRFQTMTQGMLNLSTAAAQTYTSISNLARAENQIAQSTVSVARARDQLAILEFKLNAERNKAAPNAEKIALIEQKLGTARADLAVKTDKLKLAEGNLLDVQILFVSSIANTMVSSLQTIKMLKDQHVVATIKQIYHERLVNDAIYRTNGSIAVQQGFLARGIPLLSATTRATIAQTYAQVSLTAAIRATMVALGPLGWAIIGIGAAYTAYETNVLGVKDAINGFLGISNEEIGVLHEVQSSLDEAGNAHDRYTDKIIQNNKKIGESLDYRTKSELQYFHQQYLEAETPEELAAAKKTLEFYQRQHGIEPYNPAGGPSQASSQTGGGEEEFDWWVPTAEGYLLTDGLPTNNATSSLFHVINGNLVENRVPTKTRRFNTPIGRFESNARIKDEQKKQFLKNITKAGSPFSGWENITPNPYDSLNEQWFFARDELEQLIQERATYKRSNYTGFQEHIKNLDKAIEEKKAELKALYIQIFGYMDVPNALKKEEDEEERLLKIQYGSAEYLKLTPAEQEKWMEVHVRKDQERIAAGDLDYQEIRAKEAWAKRIESGEERETLAKRRGKYGHSGGALYQWIDDKGELQTTSKLSDIPVHKTLGTPIVNYKETDVERIGYIEDGVFTPARGQPVTAAQHESAIALQKGLEMWNALQKKRYEDVTSGKIPIEQLLKPDKLTLERMLWPTSSTGQDAMLNALGIKAAGSRSYIGTRRGISGLSLSYAINDLTGKSVKTDRGEQMIKSYLAFINKQKIFTKGITSVPGIFDSESIQKKLFREWDQVFEPGKSKLFATPQQSPASTTTKEMRGAPGWKYYGINFGTKMDAGRYASLVAENNKGIVVALQEAASRLFSYGSVGHNEFLNIDPGALAAVSGVRFGSTKASALSGMGNVANFVRDIGDMGMLPTLARIIGVDVPPMPGFPMAARFGPRGALTGREMSENRLRSYMASLSSYQASLTNNINAKLDLFANPLGMSRDEVTNLVLQPEGFNDLENRLRFREKLASMSTGTNNF